MANVAEQCRNLNVFFNGVGWAGRVDSFQPPTVESTVEDYRGGGMDGPVPLRMGQEAMESQIIFNGYHSEVITSWGLADSTAVRSEVRGALEDYTGEVKGIRFTMEGPVTSLEPDEIKGQGEVPKVTVMQKLHYYKIELDGTPVLEIDFILMKRIVNGVDQLEALRGVLGL
jgi:P2 family phage contractile tail tube protein